MVKGMTESPKNQSSILTTRNKVGTIIVITSKDDMTNRELDLERPKEMTDRTQFLGQNNWAANKNIVQSMDCLNYIKEKITFRPEIFHRFGTH